MRRIHKMELVLEQTSQAALKDLITRHVVNTDTEGLNHELQPRVRMNPCTILNSSLYRCTYA